MSRHTPGPWAAVPGTKNKTAYVRGPEQEAIADVLKYSVGYKQQEANALLIAAAPEMLEALERQVENIRHWLDTGIPANAEESESMYNQMFDAISKAIGEKDDPSNRL
jgi:hypothetical protein